MCGGLYASVVSPSAGQASAHTRDPRGYASPMISQQVSRFGSLRQMCDENVCAHFLFVPPQTGEAQAEKQQG